MNKTVFLSWCQNFFHSNNFLLKCMYQLVYYMELHHLLAIDGGPVSENVVAKGVCQVVQEVLIWPLSSQDSLSTKAKHCQHSQSSILHFFSLKLHHGFFILAQIEQVEECTTCISTGKLTNQPTPVFILVCYTIPTLVLGFVSHTRLHVHTSKHRFLKST